MRYAIDRELIMKKWDTWRKYIADGGTASWPRDAFESILDEYEEIISGHKERIKTLNE